MRMAAENQGRREFGSAIVSTIAGLGLAQQAQAAGDGPKFSVFGLIGNKGLFSGGDLYSENGAYGSDQSQPTFSPYSPFSPASDASLARDSKILEGDIAFQKGVFEKSLGRFSTTIEKPIEKKQWLEVTTQMTRQMYNMRASMNYLSKNSPEAKATAKTFYQDIEALDLACKRKNQDAAFASYKKALTDLDKFQKLI